MIYEQGEYEDERKIKRSDREKREWNRGVFVDGKGKKDGIYFFLFVV